MAKRVVVVVGVGVGVVVGVAVGVGVVVGVAVGVVVVVAVGVAVGVGVVVVVGVAVVKRMNTLADRLGLQVIWWGKWIGVGKRTFPDPLNHIYDWSLCLGWLEIRKWHSE